ncbi:MAG TPA: TetR family transcriptional regulator [Paracoccaceae bacterium]|nr:TetR family transcriptional regulator [Paracoccaceae bacterium]
MNDQVNQLVDADSAAAGLRQGAADQTAAEAMHRRIVETAERLYRQFGYQKTTVADIAAELGMSPANVYRFFASKSAITEAVARKVTSEVAEAAREAASTPGLSARERLRRVVRINYNTILQRCVTDNRMHAMVHAAIEESWGVIHAHKEAMRRIMAQIIGEGVATGEFAVDDVDHAARCFQYATVSCCHPLLIEHRLKAGDDLEASIEPLLEFCFRGLGANGPG